MGVAARGRTYRTERNLVLKGNGVQVAPMAWNPGSKSSPSAARCPRSTASAAPLLTLSRLMPAVRRFNSTQSCHAAKQQAVAEIETSVEPGVASQIAHPAATGTILPPAVNWHLEARCNYGCKFCFATFEDIPRSQIVSSLEDLLQVPGLLVAAGASKLTFVGGEPMLHPHLQLLLASAKAAGLTTCLVTNGSLLTAGKLEAMRPNLDWLALSIDASNDEIHTRMGRGLHRDVTQPGRQSQHLQGGRLAELWDAARELGYRLKLNTVVCRENLEDDMTGLVLKLRPHRWKVFQVLPVEGQNDAVVDPLLISDQEFAAWVHRHQAAVKGTPEVDMVVEDNNAMTGTYAMLDARCRFYTNTQGGYHYGPSLLDVGVEAAWRAAVDGSDFRVDAFLGRGAVYDWGQGSAVLREQLMGLGGQQPC